MQLATIVLYCIAGVLGVWSSTLLWRMWLIWRLRRPARARAGVTVPDPGVAWTRRRLGLVLSLIAMLLAGGVAAAAEALENQTRWFGDAPWLSIGVRVGSALLIVSALGAAYAAVRFDPAHGRRRCGRCWYDMSATEGLLCTECGREATSERHLRRTRRAPRLLVFTAILGLSAMVLDRVPLASQRGWGMLIPTWAMIAGFEWLPDSLFAGSDDALKNRFYDSGLTGELDAKFLAWRCRRVLRTSSDLETMERAAELARDVLGHNGRADGEMSRFELGTPGTLAFLRQLCSDDAPLPPPPGTFINTQPSILWMFLPERVPSDGMQTAVRLIDGGLRSPNISARQNAASCMFLLGEHGGGALASAAAVLKNESEDMRTRTLVIAGLAMLAGNDDVAWECVEWAAESDDSALKFAAARYLRLVNGRDQQVLQLARRHLDDPRDPIASSAATLIAIKTSPICDAAPELLDFMERRPAASASVASLIAEQCMSDRLVAIIERLLQSTSVTDQEVGASIAASTGPRGERLLPILDSFRKYLAANDVRWDNAQRSAEHIRQMLKATQDQKSAP